MEAWIKFLGDITENYNRFGRLIPKEETKIDVASFFGCDADRERFIIEKFLHDTKLFFKLHKPVAETPRVVVETIEAKVEVEKKEIKRGRRPKEA